MVTVLADSQFLGRWHSFGIEICQSEFPGDLLDGLVGAPGTNLHVPFVGQRRGGVAQQNFFRFFGGADVVEQRREGGSQGVKVDLAFGRGFFDAGGLEVDVQAASGVVGHEEEGLCGHVEALAAVFLVERRGDVLAAVVVKAIQKPAGQRLQAVPPPLGPLGDQPDAAVLAVEMPQRKLTGLVGAQTAQEGGFVQDAPVGRSGRQQLRRLFDREGTALDLRPAIQKAQFLEGTVFQVVAVDAPGGE